MTNVDKQRFAAVRLLEILGYTLAAGERHPPAAAVPFMVHTAEAMHGVLVPTPSPAARRNRTRSATLGDPRRH